MGQFESPKKRSAVTVRNAYTIVSLLTLGLFAAGAAIADAQTTTTASSATTSSSTATTTAMADTASSSSSTTATTTTSTTQAEPNVVETAPASLRGSLNATQQQRVINLAANISNQLETTVRRLQTISQRLQLRSDRIAGTGGEVTAANTAIAETNQHINEARRALATIDQDVYGVATAPNPASAWAPVKAKYQRAQMRLINAQRSAEAAIAALRATQ